MALTKDDIELIRNMAIDIAIIKKTTEPIPQMYKDIYVGNGEPPLRDTCREFIADKKAKETAVTKALDNKSDGWKWLKRTAWGALITGMISAIIGVAVLYIKLLPALSAIK